MVLLRTFGYYYKNYPKRLFGVTILLIISSIAESAGIASLLPAIGIILDPSQLSKTSISLPIHENILQILVEFPQHILLGSLLTVIFGAILIKSVFSLLAIKSSGKTRALIAKHYRLRIIEAISAVEWSFFIRQRSGSLVNVISNEPDQASRCFMAVSTFLAALFHCIMYGLLALWGSVEATIAAALIGTMLFFLVRILSELRRKACYAQVDERSILSAWFNDMVLNMKGLKAMNLTGNPAKVVQNTTATLDRLMQKEIIYGALQTSLLEPIFVAVLAVGIFFFTIVHPVDFAGLIFMVLIFQRLMTYISQLFACYQQVVSTSALLEKIEIYISDIERKKEIYSGKKFDLSWQCIQFDGISIKYEEKTVLSSFSAVILRGEMTILRGPSGSGKTSLLDILTGLVPPQEGQLKIGDYVLDEIDISDWRSRIGYVPQEPLLLNSSIRKNLILSDDVFSDEQCWYALKLAGLESVVLSLPNQLENSVGERGSSLSGGQRQRLAIARALLRTPDLLILDEATSSLDEATSLEIARTVRRLTDRTTVLAVSHKDDFAPLADKIIDLR